MSKARLIIAVERDGSQVSYSSTGRSATRASRTGPARPCRGEITLSFTWRSRQSATRPPTSPGSIRSEAKITRSTPPASASKASTSCSSTRLRCMSGNSSSLRRIISARSPSPRTAVTSGGVSRRQAQRAAPRSTRAAEPATTQASSAALGSTSPAGVCGRISTSIATPAAAQAASAGSSSTVRWRIATWSRSYSPISFASTTQPGSRTSAQKASANAGCDHEARERGGDQVRQREHAPAQGVAPEPRPGGVGGAAPVAPDGRRAFRDHLQRLTRVRAKGLAPRCAATAAIQRRPGLDLYPHRPWPRRRHPHF